MALIPLDSDVDLVLIVNSKGMVTDMPRHPGRNVRFYSADMVLFLVIAFSLVLLISLDPTTTWIMMGAWGFFFLSAITVLIRAVHMRMYGDEKPPQEF